MENEVYCPLKNLVVPIPSQQGSSITYNTACFTQCAWYDHRREQCYLATLAQAKAKEAKI